MKRHNDQRIQQVISEVFGNPKLKKGYYRFLVRKFWMEEMSPLISNATESIILRGNTLSIKVNSAPLKQELLYHKKQMIARINEYLHEDYVQEIKIG